jgi:cation diffusion facilitator family transporter
MEGWLSVGCNTILFILKYWAGIVTGSIAIIADAWHTLSDSISSVIVIFGARVTKKPADTKHPFGHGRAELIATLFIGVFLAIVAFNFLMESIGRLQARQSINYNIFALIIIILSTILKEALAQFSKWAAKKINSKALYADAWHHRSDALASALILIGILLAPYFWWIDGVLGIIISMLIFYVTFDIIKDTINPLLGEIPPAALIDNIKKICYQKTHLPVNIHHIHMHRYGNHTELTFHIRLEGKITLQEAHNIASDIEDSIRSELNIESTIHMEPDSQH